MYPEQQLSTKRTSVNNDRRLISFMFLAAFITMVPAAVRAQTYLETYGQNRIQYRKFDWKIFETKHFRIFHYDRSGKDLARYVAEQAENDLEAIEHKTASRFDQQFNIIVYNSYDEYRQTNIGRKGDAQQLQLMTAGKVNVAEDKLVVYFDGVHTDLRKQILNGVSRILLERSMSGGSVKDVLKNAATVNIPDWVSNGYIAYSADGWDEKTDKAWKGLIETYPARKFYDFTEIDADLAGRAFWKYIAERYGKKDVKALLNVMHTKKNINKGLKSKYHLNVVKVFDSCLAFYKNAYLIDAANKETPDTALSVLKIPVPKDGSTIRDIRMSPRGGDVAYVKWKNGIFQVCLQETKQSKTSAVIIEGGAKDYNDQQDPNYPILAWSNTGYKLAVLYQKGSGMRLRIYDALKGKIGTYVVPGNRFDRALGMAFDEDNDGIILSAIRKSQTDLYLFTIKGTKMQNITNDLWDDVSPAFVTGGRKRGIVFMSNRPKPNLNVPAGVNELPTAPMNVYFYNTTTKSTSLLQCSNSEPNAKVSQPIQYGSDNFAYLYDLNGVRNKYIVVFGRNKYNMDSAYWVPVSNYATSLTSHQYNPAGNVVADVIEQDGFYNVYMKPLQIPGVDIPVKKPEPALLVEKESDKIGLLPNEPAHKKQSRKAKRSAQQFNKMNVNDGNTFQTEFAAKKPVAADSTTVAAGATAQADEGEPAPEDEIIHVPEADSSYMKMKASPYRVGFKPNNFSISLDNSLLFTKYQSASQNGSQFSNPPLAGLITLSLDDMLEDYRFTGGFRLPFNSVGTTYFLQFENVKRRLDWSLSYFHSSNMNNYNVTFSDSTGNPLFSTMEVGKTITNLVQGAISYPFDRLRSIRAQLGFRQDVLNFKSIDTLSLNMVSDKKYWTMSRVEFVYDNTKNITTNIRNGLRYKVFGEYMYQMNENGGGLYNFGFDFRNYTKLYKNLIWALRVAGAHSGGKQKILYFLGGVDNWIGAQYNQYMPVSQENYGFQALATNLRGYKQNARNGNSYAVANSEFRFPILSDLMRRPIQSKILRNLQLVAFTDVGAAWNGLLPNETNISKPSILTQSPVTVSVSTPGVSGVAMGYGAGIRTVLLGYSIRVDAAWNIEGQTTPIIYFSLGTDF